MTLSRIIYEPGVFPLVYKLKMHCPLHILLNANQSCHAQAVRFQQVTVPKLTAKITIFSDFG